MKHLIKFVTLNCFATQMNKRTETTQINRKLHFTPADFISQNKTCTNVPSFTPMHPRYQPPPSATVLKDTHFVIFLTVGCRVNAQRGLNHYNDKRFYGQQTRYSDIGVPLHCVYRDVVYAETRARS